MIMIMNKYIIINKRIINKNIRIIMDKYTIVISSNKDSCWLENKESPTTIDTKFSI